MLSAHNDACQAAVPRCWSRAMRCASVLWLLSIAAPVMAHATDAPDRDLVVPGPVAPLTMSARVTALQVPNIEQEKQRCGPAALEMVLSYYGAGPEALLEAGRAYDPVLRGALITDLASAARRAGYEAEVETLTPLAVIALLQQGVPPILLYQNGNGPLTVRHFGVVTGWDAALGAFTLNDGTAHPRTTRLAELVKRWKPAGSQALVVRRRQP